MFFQPSLPTGKHREKSDKFKPGLDHERFASRKAILKGPSYGIRLCAHCFHLLQYGSDPITPAAIKPEAV